MSGVIHFKPSLTQLSAMSAAYAAAAPFPHIVIDDFLDADVAAAALAAFPSPDSEAWIRYRHVSSRKLGKTDRRTFPEAIGRVIDDLNSPACVQMLEAITGIRPLLADPMLEGGGMHQSLPGGYLDIHADFTVHGRRPEWRRRVNLLVYLNRDWQDAYGGHLELWDRNMTACVQRIAPVLNRCVIFTTDEDSYHGHPDPLRCTEGMTRKSLALYYYTHESAQVRVRTTSYHARPTDSIRKKIMIAVNTGLLQLHDRMKRRRRRVS